MDCWPFVKHTWFNRMFTCVFCIRQLDSVIATHFQFQTAVFSPCPQWQMERVTVVGIVGSIEGVFDFLFDSITSLSLNGVNVNICVVQHTSTPISSLFPFLIGIMHRGRGGSVHTLFFPQFWHLSKKAREGNKEGREYAHSFEAYLY